MMARNLKRGSKVCYVIGEWPDCSAILQMAASVLDFFLHLKTILNRLV